MAVWIANRRLFLANDGTVVEATDPRKATLLVPEGGALPMEQAKALGLVAEPAPVAAPEPTPKARHVPANKARRRAAEDK